MAFEDSYDLFCRKAFVKDGVCPDDLTETAKDIVRNCVSLPLAIVAAGSMMSRKKKNRHRMVLCLGEYSEALEQR